MNGRCTLILVLSVMLSSCAHQSEQGTIAELDDVHIVPKDVKVEGGLEKAMQGYQKFLQKTPDSELTPEAIRRIADLKLEKEYGVVADGDGASEPNSDGTASSHGSGVAVTAPSTEDMSRGHGNLKGKEGQSASAAFEGESDKAFEKRTTQEQQLGSAAGKKKLVLPDGKPGADLQNADADQAIALYKKLLKKYPFYERNDQVLYQLSRAYEETGRVDEAMAVMNRLVKQFPDSRYTDEVQFRRGEYFFTRKKYLDAEDAYGAVLTFGVKTVYYQRALYKKGWTFYKEGMYEEALQQFLALLDYKVSTGYDFDQKKDNIERKRVSDTLRVISLSFSNLGGPTAVQDYFRKYGARSYEDRIYSALAEFYFAKRRYSDAATTYNTFVAANPFHRKAPQFSMRVIQIYMKGGFPRLVVGAKKQFAATYALDGEYWKHFNKDDRPEVLGYLKTNLIDLADHYHSLYQNKKFRKDRPANFAEASHWYRAFLKSFPKDKLSAGINYQLAELLLENGNYKAAAVEYEHSAYDYPTNDNSPKAAYATVYAYREYLKTAPASEVNAVKQDIIRTSLRLVDTFPKHEKATVVLGALVDDLFEMKNYEMAIKEGHRLIDDYPDADKNIRRGAWLDVAHSSYEIKRYQDAEQAYIETLKMTAADAKDRQGVIDDLAASVYKQGEVAKAKGDYKTAVRHFLRIAEVAPTSKIRPSAEYDAAAVLIQMKDLERAAGVLLSFRKNYPGHKLQHDVTKKLAYVYKGLGKNIQAAQEYERVAANESKDELVREAMVAAAELYGKAQDTNDSLRVYKQYVEKFPEPLEPALETYYKIAEIYKSQGNQGHYFGNLRYIISADAKGGKERTDRTRYLAAQASLELVEPRRVDYMAIKLVKPFKASLNKKEKSMKSLVRAYARLVDYHVADVTAASTYYIAEIYYNFDQSLLKSERPDNLSDVELDQFNEMVEEQAYPFEVKAIQVHEKNVALLKNGIRSVWIDRSIEKLAKLVPARYGKPEQSANFITKINSYMYSSPRYLRDDASIGYIEHLSVFRYSSQNQDSMRNQSASEADTNAEATSAPKSETVTSVPPQKTGKAKLAATSTTGHEASDAGSPAQVTKAVDATVKIQDPPEEHTVKTADTKVKSKKIDSDGSDSNTSASDAQAGNATKRKSTVTGESDGDATEDKTATQGQTDDQKTNEPVEDVTSK
jgi:tetratricopeptide (TPR) repeat protein